MPRVAVVGAGIAGLVAARRLADAGADPVLLEASDRVGGQIRTIEHDGVRVDVGAEALHTAAPQALALVDELGLSGEVVTASPGTTWIQTPSGLRPMPGGLGPAGPTRLLPLATSRVLSVRGTARAGLEPLLPASAPEGDVSIGAYLAHRFGREAVDRLIDPLLGNLHAGDVWRLSLLAATPMLAALAGCHRSLLLGSRTRNGSATAFVTLRRGLADLAGALASDPRIEVRLGHQVEAVATDGPGVRLEGPEPVEADAVVLAVPAAVGARLLAGSAPDTAATVRGLRTATVATVIASYPAAAVAEVPALAANGLLLPSTSGHLLKAATFLSTKWPHLAGTQRFLVRLSAGRAGDDRVARLDDEALVAALHGDLAALTGLADPPVAATVQRWPGSLAQLEVGHLDRLAELERTLRSHPGVVLAGAAYAGVGIAACIRSGERAAMSVSEQLAQLRTAGS